MKIFVPLLFVVLAPMASAVERPDILIVMADDMGYSDIGCFGGEIRTPHLDRLASNGLRFTNFYSENMCWVSRAALLTGVYHKTSMIKGRLHTRCETLPEALRPQRLSDADVRQMASRGQAVSCLSARSRLRRVLRNPRRSIEFLRPGSPHSEPKER